MSQWTSPQSFALFVNPMELHGTPWNLRDGYVALYGTPRSVVWYRSCMPTHSMAFYGGPWNFPRGYIILSLSGTIPIRQRDVRSPGGTGLACPLPWSSPWHPTALAPILPISYSPGRFVGAIRRKRRTWGSCNMEERGVGWKREEWRGCAFRKKQKMPPHKGRRASMR